jgi:hypothetical protein
VYTPFDERIRDRAYTPFDDRMRNVGRALPLKQPRDPFSDQQQKVKPMATALRPKALTPLRRGWR